MYYLYCFLEMLGLALSCCYLAEETAAVRYEYERDANRSRGTTIVLVGEPMEQGMTTGVNSSDAHGNAQHNSDQQAS